MIETASVIAFARRYWWALAIVVLLVATATVTRSCTVGQQSRASSDAIQRNDGAKDAAAIERRRDDASISNTEKERQDAIQAAPSGATGPATRALNCRRWMQQHPGADRPANC